MKKTIPLIFFVIVLSSFAFAGADNLLGDWQFNNNFYNGTAPDSYQLIYNDYALGHYLSSQSVGCDQAENMSISDNHYLYTNVSEMDKVRTIDNLSEDPSQ